MEWLLQVQKRIFPVSLEKNDLKKALGEWEYRENVYDLGSPDADCELCGHADIRYQFEIVNRINSNRLLIGSECITRYSDISVYQGSNRISDPNLARQKVGRDRGRLITEAHTKAVINSLINLAKVDQDFGQEKIESFIIYYQERGAFTPRQLSTLIWRLEKHQVDFKKFYLKMTIKKNIEKEQFLSMENWRIRKIYNSLSASQKKFLLKHKK